MEKKQIVGQESGMIALDPLIYGWALFSSLGLSLFDRSSTMNLPKHETRKLYFENKGVGQVLLGAPDSGLLRSQGRLLQGWKDEVWL